MTYTNKNADYSIPAMHLLQGMRQKKIVVSEVLASVGISEDTLSNKQTPLHYSQFLSLLKTVNRTTQDEFFALTPNRCKPGSYAMMVQTGLPSNTLQAFIEHCCQFYYLLTDDVVFSIDIHGEKTTISVVLSHPEYDPNQLLAEYWLLHLYLTFSWVCGLRLPLLALSSMVASEPSADRLLYYIRPRWNVSQSSHSFSFHSKYLKLPIVKTRVELSAHLKSGRGQLPVWPSDKMTVSSQVKAYLTQGLELQNSCENIDQIATKLNTTVRSLRRNLKDEGTSYQHLLDDCRRDYAIELLGVQHVNVANVAELLGFSEPRSFSRAFKQWTGSAPSHFQDTK